MAIVEMDTAVEMTVMHYLFQFLTKAGKKLEEIAELFNEDNRSARDLHEKGYLTTNNRIKRLEEFINEERSKKGQPTLSVFSTQEYKDWKTDVRKKRNLSSHMWAHFAKEDAEKAFHSAQTFLRYLQREADALLTTTDPNVSAESAPTH